MDAAHGLPHDVPEKKQTPLGLYVDAQEAYGMWKSDPERVSIVDVRTPEEYIFVGHPEMARNVPAGFIRYQWDTENDQPVFEGNTEFVSCMEEHYDTDHTILLACRSGGRSALAVAALAQAGYKNVYNVIDGFEGDKLDDPASEHHGKRVANGWRNSGLPWTYDCEPDLLWIDKED